MTYQDLVILNDRLDRIETQQLRVLNRLNEMDEALKEASHENFVLNLVVQGTIFLALALLVAHSSH